ncbi:MAG: tyrosine-type recombinase/integrase [Flavobacteriales bacterium]|nr:tyrosine-type recombinase/integrase [Flavobacteriales bacterium]
MKAEFLEQLLISDKLPSLPVVATKILTLSNDPDSSLSDFTRLTKCPKLVVQIIKGKQATGKGLRHGFGVAMVISSKPLPLHILAQLMGHSDTKTTEIYLQVVGEEKRQLVADAWAG